jgi:4-hydroxybenzoate polyprenyltransferase
MTSSPPLIVDLDGSLLRTDSLHEYLALALTRPTLLLNALGQYARGGRAGLKRGLASGASLDASVLPVNEEVVAILRSASASGRAVYLATGADLRIADEMAARFPEITGAFASDGVTNLTGTRKAERLVREFGAGKFDYVGDSKKDLPVWRQARSAYLVTVRPASRLPHWAREIEFAGILREDRRPTWRNWLREIRVHQSLKNLLLFLPILAAHAFGVIRALSLLVAGFFAFTLMASSVYLLNDVVDLRSDRLHSRKASRPIAAGLILPGRALTASVILAITSLAAAAAIGARFALVLVLYAVVTCLYSFWLKRVTLIDVITLAMLYMIRILAGAVITGVELSFWFTGVALFLFISIALVKRYAELSRHAGGKSASHIPGRGYAAADAPVVLSLGIGTGMAVLVLLAIYLQSDIVALLYPSAGLLWLVIPTVFYWIGNVWIQAGRGTIHDDPIVFALKNRASLVSAAVIGLLFFAASTHVASAAETALSWFGHS